MRHDEATQEEFVAFYLSHWPRLVAAIALALPPGEDAEDVAQEAFARAFEHWGELRDHPRPDGWLFLTAYRLASSLRRRAATRMNASLIGSTAPPWPDITSMDPLADLTPRQRAAILLRHHYGLSTLETASALGCREGTVKSLVARAKQSLRSSIETEGSEG